MTNSKAPFDRIPAILRLAGRKPFVSLKKWLTEFEASGSRVALETQARMLARIVTRARAGVDPAEAESLELLIAEAWQRIGRAKRRLGAPIGLGFALTDATQADVQIGGAMSNAERLPRHSPDLLSLDAQTAKWSKSEWMHWLREGLAAVNTDQSNAHLAFPPLRLYPVGRYVEQLAAVLVEAVEFESTMRESALGALATDLATTKGPSPLDPLLWRLFRLLGPKDPTARVAQGYVAGIERSGARNLPDSVAEELCETAYRCVPEASARSYFFEQLAEKIDSPFVIAELIAANLTEAASDDEFGMEEVQIAAVEALKRWSLGNLPLTQHLAHLIEAGRFQMLGAEIHAAILSAAELRRDLVNLVSGYRPTDDFKKLPPAPRTLTARDVARLAELADEV